MTEYLLFYPPFLNFIISSFHYTRCFVVVIVVVVVVVIHCVECQEL